MTERNRVEEVGVHDRIVLQWTFKE